MGSAGFRVAQGYNRGLNDVIKKEARFVLRIVGHHKENIESKCVKCVPFKSTEEITKRALEENIKEFKSYDNIFEKLELYRVSTRKLSYHSIENYKL